jgi:phospholipid/cholesterol/gamma-HCH transport system permease protein
MPETEQRPEATLETNGSQFRVALSGDWVLQSGAPPFDQLDLASMESKKGVGIVAVVGPGLGRWDTSLLPFLLAANQFCRDHELTLNLDALPEGIRKLFTLATAVPVKEDASHEEEDGGFFGRIGLWAMDFREGADAWFEFIGRLFFGLVRLVRGKAQVRFRDFTLVVESTGAMAFPIVSLISFLVGLIITFLGIVVLVRFNAEYYVSYLVGYGMLREMGALMTGIILSGRTGAAFAAQIGSMKVNEEIDALRAAGVDPVEFLVLPRVLALVLMMPLLVIYSIVVGIISGMAIANTMQGMAPEIFVKGLLEAVTVADLGLGLFKSVVFGVLIGMSGCLRGLQSGSDANAVGLATTRAVVTSITLIVAFNALIDWIAAIYNI